MLVAIMAYVIVAILFFVMLSRCHEDSATPDEPLSLPLVILCSAFWPVSLSYIAFL